MMLPKIIGQHKASISRIAKRHGARNVRIFGSVVRGEEKNDSDIDFLIALDEGRTYFDVVRLKHDLEQDLGRPVDVVLDTAVKPILRQEILRSALPI